MPVAFIEDNNFLQSSFLNENGIEVTSNQINALAEERRAKSSLGTADNSASRLRNKLVGAQK